MYCIQVQSSNNERDQFISFLSPLQPLSLSVSLQPSLPFLKKLKANLPLNGILSALLCLTCATAAIAPNLASLKERERERESEREREGETERQREREKQRDGSVTFPISKTLWASCKQAAPNHVVSKTNDWCSRNDESIFFSSSSFSSSPSSS
jgi:hypothetical protein